MGELMRQYWLPAMLSSEVAAPDSDPMRVRLLGEKLIAFRDTNGKVGLIQNNCPHRGASLFFGRNEEAGLRCVYHGWKFDVDGACIDMPNEPAESDFKSKVRAVAYPTQRARRHRLGVYRARADAAAAARTSRPTSLPRRATSRSRHPARVQLVAGARGRHRHVALRASCTTARSAPRTASPGTFWYYALQAPRAALRGRSNTDVGVPCTAPTARPHEDQHYWRIAQFLFPFYTMPPSGRARPAAQLHCLGADGRRAHACSVCSRRGRARGCAQRRDGVAALSSGMHAQHHRLVRPLPVRRQRRQRLPDRPRRCSARTRASTATPASPASTSGPGRHREHGADLRSQPGAPRHQRRDDHSHATAPDRRRPRAGGTRRTPPGVDDPDAYWSALAASSCRNPRTGSKRPATCALHFPSTRSSTHPLRDGCNPC